MRNIISVKTITETGSQSVTNPIDGIVASPVVNAMLQDERLDEANIIVYQSSTKVFERGLKMRVTIKSEDNEGTETRKDIDYIVANDHSVEMPVGSGKYKHEIYLIEETKRLEGIICQSLCFTNTSGNNYTANANDIIPSMTENPGANFLSPEDLSQAYESPILSGNNFVVKSIADVGNIIMEKMRAYDGGETLPVYGDTVHLETASGDYTPYRYAGYTIRNGDTITEYTLDPNETDESKIITLDSTQTITPKPTILLTYQIIVAGIDRRTGNSTTFLFNFTYTIYSVQNKYRTKLWTVTDCVNRVLELAKPLYANESPRYKFDGVSYSNGQITGSYKAGSQAEKYDKILAPEFTMTQCTLREQLKVIGGFINAEPRLSGNTIYFDEYGGTGKPATVGENHISKAYSADINDFCKEIDTSAQNLVNTLDYAQGVVCSPNRCDFLSLRTDSVNVRVEENNGFIYTQLPIYQIQSVKCTVFNEDGTIFSGMENVDITPYIVEETEYMANMSSYDTDYPRSKAYALYYTQGSNHIKGLFFKVPNVVSSVFSRYAIINILSRATGQAITVFDNFTYALLSFQVSYIPIYSARFSHGKQKYNTKYYQDFTKIYNQSENLIETRYYGENVKGVVSRLGNVAGTYTYITYDINKIPSLGEMIGEYAITSIATTFYTTFIKVTLGLSLDYQNISQYVGVQSNKRVYEVSEKQAYNRSILLKDIMICTRSGDLTGSNSIISKGHGRSQYMSIFKDYNPEFSYCVTAVQACGKSKDYSRFEIIRLPVVSAAFGNAMIFSWSYKDNYSAGTNVDKISGKTSGDLSGYMQSDVPYGDYFGRIYYYDFYLFGEEAFLQKSGDLNDAKHLPLVTSQSGSVFINTGINTAKITGSLSSYRLRKDSRETLNFNYELETQTTEDDIIIGSALAQNCPLVTLATHEAPKVYFLSRKLGKFEKNIDLTSDIVKSSGGIQVSERYISFNLHEGVFFEAWAICTPQTTETINVTDDSGNDTTQTIKKGGDIILASNKGSANYGATTIETLFFVPTRRE